MGCLKNRDADMEFSEILISNGRPQKVDFKRRNRRIVWVKPLDPEFTFSHNHEAIYFSGPAGAEAVVVFKIL